MPAAVAGRDRREFAEFYADYDRHQGFTGMTGWALTGPIRYTGHAALARDIANFKAAAKGAKTAGLFMAAVAPASVAPDRNDEYYKSDEEYVFAVADALHEEYKAIIDAGLILQVDDAYLALHLRGHGAAEDAEGLPQMGERCASRRSTTRSRDCRRSAPAITCAGEAGTGRTPSMSSSRTSSISSSRCESAATCWKWPIRVTSTNGGYGSG